MPGDQVMETASGGGDAGQVLDVEVDVAESAAGGVLALAGVEREVPGLPAQPPGVRGGGEQAAAISSTARRRLPPMLGGASNSTTPSAVVKNADW
jgi:hypothetical protein